MRPCPKEGGKFGPGGPRTCSRTGWEGADQAGKTRSDPARRALRMLAAAASLLDRDGEPGPHNASRKVDETAGEVRRRWEVTVSWRCGCRRAAVSPHDDPSRSMAGTLIQGEVLGQRSSLEYSLRIPWVLPARNLSCPQLITSVPSVYFIFVSLLRFI